MSKKKNKDDYMTDLQVLLAKRLRLSRSWNNVSLTNNKREVNIKWFDNKYLDDPKGEYSFSLRGCPYTLDGLAIEVGKQKAKLRKDRYG
jgi:hypothetical protein